ncbi:MAG: hypothetical protein M0D55_07215 [Elusimicrobiota bacterium]|nr:MAG: hypothetical protein M0D55_07215 [Elusimicrobiota bacterium]
MRDSLEVIDQVLKRDLPQGPGWRRYNHDGYGEKADGRDYDGTGEGRCWPILSGERGHYELAAGHDPLPFIDQLENMANEGAMLPEQLWDTADLPDGKMILGGPTGSAMPLCWAHAEYVTLVRSRKDGVCFDRIEPVYQRYAKAKTGSNIEMWTFAHQLQRIPHGKTLRIITESAATILWSFDGRATTNELAARDAGFGCWCADLPSNTLQSGAQIVFTVQNKDFKVQIID